MAKHFSQSQIKSQAEKLEKEVKTLTGRLRRQAQKNDSQDTHTDLHRELNLIKRDIHTQISELETSIKNNQEDIVKLKQADHNTPSFKKMIVTKEDENIFLKSQIKALDAILSEIDLTQLTVLVTNPDNSVYQAFGNHEYTQNNNAKGTLGEAIVGYVTNEILPGCYLLSDSYEISNGKKRHRDIDTEELAFISAKDYFNENSDKEYVLANREIYGGASNTVDVVMMLISRKDVENWLQGKPNEPVYFVFEAKTDSSKLSKAQQDSSYVKNQAAKMYRYDQRNKAQIPEWQKECRRKLGKDLLKATQEDRVHYFFYRLDTKSAKITELDQILSL